MTRLFISYSRSDRLFLETFILLIRKVYGNNSLWYDDDIHGGVDWWSLILSEIGNCELFIYLISNESLESPYCQSELREAIRLNKKILPVIVRRLKSSYPANAPSELKPILNKIQYVDLIDMRETTNIANLYAAINRLLERSTSLAPQTSQPISQPPVLDKKRTSVLKTLVENYVIIVVSLIGLISIITAVAIGLPKENNITNSPGIVPTLIGGGKGEIAYHANNEIFVANANGIGETHRILGGDGAIYAYPSFSPDGQKVAFFSNRNGNIGVWVADADGTNAVEIDNPNTLDWGGLAWSPNGNRIVFSRDLDNGTSQLFVTSAIGRNTTQLTCGSKKASNPTWSADSTKVVFRYGNDEASFKLVMVDVDPPSIACQSETDKSWVELKTPNCSSWKPKWSFKNNILTYNATCRDDKDFEIFLMDVNAPETARKLTDNNYDDITPEISPDGTLIALGRNNSIVLISAKTGEFLKDLGTDNGGSNLSWRP